MGTEQDGSTHRSAGFTGVSKTKAATFDAVAESHFDALDSLFNDRTDSYPSFKTIVISPLNESH